MNVALLTTLFTAARGLYAPLVVLAALAIALSYGTWAGVGAAAAGGAALLIFGYVQEGLRGWDLVLTAVAVVLWMLIVAGGCALAGALRRRDADLAADAKELSRRALHDPLTDLPNRDLFWDRLGHALGGAKRHDTRAAVLFVDLDGFKAINDDLGHAAGDELLVAVARRLSRDLREVDTAARVGGDEFAVVCEDLPNEQEPVVIGHRIIDALAAPFTVAGRELTVRASVGVAVSEHGDRIAASADGDGAAIDLVRAADAAMYRAKRSGGARVVVAP